MMSTSWFDAFKNSVVHVINNREHNTIIPRVSTGTLKQMDLSGNILFSPHYSNCIWNLRKEQYTYVLSEELQKVFECLINKYNMPKDVECLLLEYAVDFGVINV